MTDDPAMGSDRHATTVFVSYSRSDLALARPVIDALEAHGFDVWWDGLLTGGDAFAQTTETALETANAVVVLWTGQSIQSHWVRDEATRGRDRGCMVPVSLDGTIPPLGFRQIQYIDLSGWKGSRTAPAFADLSKAIEATAAAPHGQLSFMAARQGSNGVSRRRALAAAGGLVAVLGGGFAAWRGGVLGGGAKANSIAILPFRNIGGNKDEDYFSDGLAEELRSTLSLNHLLEVTAQTSVNAVNNGGLDATAIAAKLGVAYVLEGSVRRAQDRLRIAVRLVDGGNGFEKWSQSFDRVAADVFALQDEIATTVADAMATNVGAEASQNRAGTTRNKDALDAYLKGQALYKLGRDEQSDRDALAQFDLALKLDQKYAAAAAARSRTLTAIANSYASGDELKALYGAAIDAAKAAVALAPDLAVAHSALGFVLFNGRLDAASARGPYQRSFELGFGNADILSSFANYAGRSGDFEAARKAIARAQKLDPLNALVFRSAGNIEFGARNFPAALAALRSALTIAPEQSGVYVVLGDIELLAGRAAQARAEYEREGGSLSRLRGLACADMKLGKAAEAEKSLAAMVAEFGGNSLYQQGQVLAQWGRGDAALDVLERALSAGDSGLVQLRNDPLLDPVRGNQRFAALLSRLGFE